MTETLNNIQLASLASHLVFCGLQPNVSPRSDKEYAKAIAEWEQSIEFRDIANSIASGMSLAIADVNERGIALIPIKTVGNPFWPSIKDVHSIYENGIGSGQDRLTPSETRGVFSAILAVTVALAYPDESFLDGTKQGIRVTAKEVREKLTALAESAADMEANEESAIPGLPVLWKAVLKCAPVVTTSQGRHKDGTLGWHVIKVFTTLEDNGHVDFQSGDKSGDGEQGAQIAPKDRLRKLVRHSAGPLHIEVNEALKRLKLSRNISSVLD